jgi:hypothetical protein
MTCRCRVALVDDIEVDDADVADSSRCQVGRDRRPSPPAPTSNTLERFLLLPLHAHIGQDQVPAVPVDFISIEADFFAHTVTARLRFLI